MLYEQFEFKKSHHFNVCGFFQDQYNGGTKDVSDAKIYRTCYGPSCYLQNMLIYVTGLVLLRTQMGLITSGSEILF
ncbi:hypothetical protein BpHYR1_012432 [Brachionus plicatilis]|uniref:Uncharacterized protein n=1 Tax=Brachionus plicatilis TaxID=10195 RepID=A0A3M7SNG8_BRAPC|nr:hypothetical protein BpHYR1_012432 [Brachionus plicatilis]